MNRQSENYLCEEGGAMPHYISINRSKGEGIGLNDCLTTFYNINASCFGGSPGSLEMIPVEPGMIPVDPGMIPVEPGMIPVEMGTIPVEPGMIPVEIGTIPIKRGTIPIDTGMIPIETGMIPMDYGTISKGSGIQFFYFGRPPPA